MTRRNDTARLTRDPFRPTPEMREFLRRRTLPFIETSMGLDRPLSFILEEVYMQGMRDAVQTIEETGSYRRVERAPLDMGAEVRPDNVQGLPDCATGG